MTMMVLKELIEAEMKKQDEDHIPKHIRAFHRQEIEEWEQDQTTFVKTRATRHILGYLFSNNSIVVTGSSGCGKSSNIHHAALHLRDSFRYEIIPVLTGPTDIINYYNENKKQVFIVDDICGKETINMQTLQMWLDYSEEMEKIFRIAGKSIENKTDDNVSMISGPKLMVSCKLHVYKESQLQFLTLLSRNECNILSKDLCLLQDERILMARMYITDDMTSKLNVIKVMEEVDFFPLLCKLAKNKSSEEVIKLFTAPVDCITQNINHIVLKNKEQFCALVLCILFDNGFDTDWLKLKSAQMNDKKLLEIVKAFNKDLSNEMSRNALEIGFNTLSGTYLKQRGTEYRMIHDKVHDMAAVVCGQHLIECFIKYSPSVFIRDHFILESLTGVVRNTNLIVILKDQEENYFDRLLCDLKCNVVTSTFHNKQLEYQLFMDKLLSFFGRSDDAKTVLKDLDTKGCITQNDVDQLEYPSYSHLETTPLIESATRGYIDIVHFLVNTVRCNVNKTDGLGQSPLYRSSKRGHSDMVKLLIEINADVIQFNDHKESPLDAACKGGYTDVVKLLMQNNTNVSWCNDYQESPLYIACERGHTDIVELLLQNNACVSKCNFEEESPLFVACEGGHIDTVALLLKNNADVSQCNFQEESPLFVACNGGHKSIVALLLQNYSCVSQCNCADESPLFVACKGGHTDIVALLLKSNADVSQCNRFEESPLYVACAAGHTDTVDVLLHNNADVSQCNNFDKSPLFVACEEGHTDTVALLLTSNADVSKCDRMAESPLYVACAAGHTDTVDILLHNNADVSQCNKIGKSPMFVACKGGHTNTVKVLLQNNAEVNQCDNRVESSLFVACAGGHTETVELLLQNNADLSQCDYIGNSPLYVACANGHKDMVELFLKKNADVSKCNKVGESPLYVACKFRCKDTVKLLLQNNADVSQCEQQDGKSPLHVACECCLPDTRMPLYRFWDPNVIWSWRYIRHDDHKLEDTYHGYYDIVKLLLAWNADVRLCDKKGQTPLEYARKSQTMDIVKLLENKIIEYKHQISSKHFIN
ncbi:ankyrin repeat domain-containing protein 50-like [Mytilus trossulus]|uniref:ankyrin repeat domain-containing protein 50-like n=1 Tax=Mytilus trossulus TaxID=6551 RepID=UPI003007CAC8